MSSTCVIGIQWGDEGKGKIIDVLTGHADMVVRYQGGSNAGHTVMVGEKKFVLHLLPSGILRKGTINVIGNGLVVDPSDLIDEVATLRKQGVAIAENLRISDRAHVVFPYHRILDGLREQSRGVQAIGTTQRGIGPCYADKIARTGIRMGEFVQPELFRKRLQRAVEEKNRLLTLYYQTDPVSFEEIHEKYARLAEDVKPFVCDTISLVHEALDNQKRVLFEGAQGSLLDIDFGTYPYATSSNSTACGISTGAGVPPKGLDRILGVMKAYTTRVGEGPFPTELKDAMGDMLQTKGHEFGATTGRPRRCGWLDLVAAGFSSRINGLDAIALTKLDVLSGLEKIKICRAYRLHGETFRHFPADTHALERVDPVYEVLDGWEDSLENVRNFQGLPDQAKAYIACIEDTMRVPVDMISVGQQRREIIFATGKAQDM